MNILKIFGFGKKTVTVEVKKDYKDYFYSGPPGMLEYRLASAESAWYLPRDFFMRLLDNPYQDQDLYVYAPRSAKGEVNSQSPLHRINDGGHPQVSEEDRRMLWATTRYRKAVAWVFHKVTPNSARMWAESKASHGYYEPMVNTIFKAIELGLVGVNPDDVK